ncbi:hypothetical protein [Massilia timonae]|uniref:hypothetical protein n=1 Tax=Massilia timonae TaxID=47229 RepID=UPI0015A55821|nr:hypothetical protein [Massilia timonae]
MTPDRPVVTNNKLRAFNIGAAIRQMEVRQAERRHKNAAAHRRRGGTSMPDTMRTGQSRRAHPGIMGGAMIPRNSGKSIQLLQLRKK